jgi:ubiquinone/menaquinone biosynthesis C-methylase UbiE
MMGEANLFSIQAEEYSKYRPKYPFELFKFLASVSRGHEKAWDCATGNGQAAIGLAQYFDSVIASDISEKQLANSFKDIKVKYFIASAEDSKIESSTIDLITVATAIHWFDKVKFFKEVKRILKPYGVLAFWNYTYTFISKDIDELIIYYVNEILGEKYWDQQALDVFRNEYTFEIPFEELVIPDIEMSCKWNLEEFIKYLYTWSSAQSYLKKNNTSPINLIYSNLKNLWGDEEERKNIKWKFLFRAYKVT